MDTESSPSTTDPARRTVLRGVAWGGLALPLLAACSDDEPAAPAAGGTTSDPAGTPADSGESSPSADGEPGADALASTSDVPVGGGTILQDDKVVLTQPAKGDFKAFTAVCTHQGCVVATVSDGTITCGCHGSQFSIKDGANVGGPNGSAAGSVADLAPIKISVEGDQITRA